MIVTANSGHTVIKELYAGIESKLSQTVKPSNYMTDKGDLTDDVANGFKENPANGKLSTTKEGAQFEFKFLGSGFELYADTDPAYGRASVEVDGVLEKEEIDLSDEPLFNKQVFLCEDLETAEHTVVITALDQKPFNISFINVQYGTPVAAGEYPAVDGDYGNTETPRQFTREWKTYVKDYQELTSIRFLQAEPQGYKDTYVRIDTYIRLYRDGKKIAFVYPGKILAPIECGSLFSGCEKLTELNLQNFDTEYMRGAMNMFYGCESLTEIDVSKFTTENVLSFGKMFGNCTSLHSMDLSNFELDENANLYRMFENCTELQTINLPEKAVGKRARRNASDGSAITFELPYVYHVEGTDMFITELSLDESMAGKTLTLHKDHKFLSSDIHLQENPTCEGTGTLAYKTCSTCRCNFDFEDESTLYRAGDLVIPATGHKGDYRYSGLWPTCTTSGGEYTYYCTVCNKTLEEGGVIEATGHWYQLDDTKGDEIEGKAEKKGYSVVYGSDGVATVTFYLKCGTYDWNDMTNPIPCLHEAEVVMTFDCETHTEANCTEDESFYYDFVIDEDALLAAINDQDTQDEFEDGVVFGSLTVRGTAKGINAIGHAMEKVDAVPETCLAYGSTEGARCSVCGVVQGVEPVEPHGHRMENRPALAPTCTAAGHSEGEVCAFCGVEAEGVKHYEPLGHDFSVEIAEELPTCTQVGHTEGHKCSRCDAIEGYDVVDDLGHAEEVVEGRAPTETESGLTDGLRCPRCGEVLKEQEEIPPLGITDPIPGGDVSASGEDPSGLGALAWSMIGLGAAAVAAAVAVTVVVVIKKKRRS